MRNSLIKLAASTIVATVMASVVVNAMPQAALAETTAIETFGADFVPSDPFVGANGWTYTNGLGRDVELVANGIDGPSLRMSNAVMDSSFGNWVFSKPLTEPATEDGNQEFTAEFDIESATHAPQPGLQISVAPQTAGGARMSFVKFIDDGTAAGGIDVEFSDARDATFRQIPIASDLDRSVRHHVKIVLDLYEGAHNDVAQVFIDDMTKPLAPATGSGFEGFFAPVDNPDTVNKAKAGQTIPLKFKVQAEPATTWEDYYRFDSESNDFVELPWGTRVVDSLVFQARQPVGGPNTNPTVEGHGFFIDNVQQGSTLTPTLPKSAAGDPSIFGDKPFTSDPYVCEGGQEVDPIEVYTPGQSGLTYNETTGVWHYNWQTPKGYAKSCVEMTLNLSGDYALFKFFK